MSQFMIIFKNEIFNVSTFVALAYKGRGYEIVAEYEAITFRTARSYIRATTLQVCTAIAMFYSLCYMLAAFQLVTINFHFY